TRMRSLRYWSKSLMSSAVGSRSNRVIEAPLTKTAFVLLTTRETPFGSRSGTGVVIGASECTGKGAGVRLRAAVFGVPGVRAGAVFVVATGVKGSLVTDVCRAFGSQVATTRFVISKSRAATRISSADII